MSIDAGEMLKELKQDAQMKCDQAKANNEEPSKFCHVEMSDTEFDDYYYEESDPSEKYEDQQTIYYDADNDSESSKFVDFDQDGAPDLVKIPHPASQRNQEVLVDSDTITKTLTTDLQTGDTMIMTTITQEPSDGVSNQPSSQPPIGAEFAIYIPILLSLLFVFIAVGHHYWKRQSVKAGETR